MNIVAIGEKVEQIDWAGWSQRQAAHHSRFVVALALDSWDARLTVMTDLRMAEIPATVIVAMLAVDKGLGQCSVFGNRLSDPCAACAFDGGLLPVSEPCALFAGDGSLLRGTLQQEQRATTSLFVGMLRHWLRDGRETHLVCCGAGTVGCGVGMAVSGDPFVVSGLRSLTFIDHARVRQLNTQTTCADLAGYEGCWKAEALCEIVSARLSSAVSAASFDGAETRTRSDGWLNTKTRLVFNSRSKTWERSTVIKARAPHCCGPHDPNTVPVRLDLDGIQEPKGESP